MKSFAEIAFTPAVRALQEKHGSRQDYAHMEQGSDPGAGLAAREAEFIAAADSFYLATVSETGWPYVQHRGGPVGFLKVLSSTRIAYADFRGNRQYVSAGNLVNDDRASIIVMDYANRQRLKLMGRLRYDVVADADPETVFAVELPEYRAPVERVGVFDVEAFDWNCPQHITQRFSAAQLDDVVRPLQARIAQLEGELEGAGLRPRRAS